MERDYLIAGLRVRMDTFGRTEAQAEAYLTDTTGTPDMVVASKPEKFKQDQPNMSMDEFEYITTGGNFYRQLLPFDGMLLHSSAVVMDGYAYLFSAPSGTGKSTHTAMWRKVFGYDKVLMLNDDKPALRLENGRWFAYGTPWSGKSDQNINMRVPLGGVCVLTRGNDNEITPFGGTQAVFALLEQTLMPVRAEECGRLLELVGHLLDSVPVWKLRCTPTPDAARMSQRAMSKEAHKRFK